MPRPGLPPTPASSADIAGKHNAAFSQTETAFALPPAAIAAGNYDPNGGSRGSTGSSTASSNHYSDSPYRPMSPRSPSATPRKRSSAALSSRSNAEDFALPPPPTRSRKIIQMKPRAQGQPAKSTQQILPATDQLASGGATSTSNKHATTQSTGGKRKQGSGNTAAGRKIARKTAHSLIERRRRSKMNEEFGVLKDMIPACAGQEMHKLAILQASIEYLRYLEQCISDLQAANRSPHRGVQPSPLSAPPVTRPAPAEDVDDEDESMTDDHESGASTPSAPLKTPTDANSTRPYVSASSDEGQTRAADSASRPTLPSISPILSNSSSTHNSPAIYPSDYQRASHGSRHYSLSSYTTHASSGYLQSALPSPAFEISTNQRLPGSSGSLAEFRLASPALKPQTDAAFQDKPGSASSSFPQMHAIDEINNLPRDNHLPSSRSNLLDIASEATKASEVQTRSRTKDSSENDGDTDMDQQATAALLMLNADRRCWDAEESRGMSVRDLLRD
ncbi:MAG: hypothetical protein M1821_005515 [Bathelium mastoideum]|nr:MAG: hypothetical protein M1821_005515 [Bathelium mastoideum]KAI9691844.1 MAG: hypothetical protein M1822_007916 [Bathelium mastoideum]